MENSKQIQIDGVVEKWCLMFVQMPPKFRFWGIWRFIYKGQKQTMKNVLFLLIFETYLNSAFRRELPNFPAIDGYHGVEFWRFSCRLKKSKCNENMNRILRGDLPEFRSVFNVSLGWNISNFILTSQKRKSPCLRLKQRPGSHFQVGTFLEPVLPVPQSIVLNCFVWVFLGSL